MKIQRTAAAALLAATISAALASGGCARNGAADSGAKRDDGSGGTASHPAKVPEDARRVAEATDTRVIHRLLREGTIYVVDGESNKVLYSGPVRAGANVVVDPAANAITINDQQVKPKTNLQPRHTYRLYFLQK